MSIKDSIEETVELENKSPQSTRLYTKAALISSTLALLVFFVCLVCYQIDHILGLDFFAAIFIPEIILFLFAMYLSVAERLRAKYLGAIIAIVISCLVFICVLSFLIFELVKFHEIFIAPFNPPPHR